VLICCEKKIPLAGWWPVAGAELIREKNTANICMCVGEAGGGTLASMLHVVFSPYRAPVCTGREQVSEISPLRLWENANKALFCSLQNS
jgi:hypothetical protein